VIELRQVLDLQTRVSTDVVKGKGEGSPRFCPNMLCHAILCPMSIFSKPVQKLPAYRIRCMLQYLTPVWTSLHVLLMHRHSHTCEFFTPQLHRTARKQPGNVFRFPHQAIRDIEVGGDHAKLEAKIAGMPRYLSAARSLQG